MKKIKCLLSSLSAIFVVVLSVCCLTVTPVSAEGDMGGLTGGDAAQVQEDRGAGVLGDALKDYEPIDEENMAEAKTIAKPITNIIGNLVGVITLITAAGIFFVTACDLAYIAMPFTRPLLTSKHQLVSDEALSVVGMMGGQGGAAAGQMGGMGSPMGGMGSPMGGMGSPMGSPMGGMGAPMGGMGSPMGGQPQQQMGTKSAITQYFKKRIVFIVIFTVAMILLTSSAITGVGINLAALLFKLIEKLNGMINGINI